MNDLELAEQRARELIRDAEAKARDILASSKTENPSNSILEVKLDYIQKDLAVIKGDVKEIKADFISRREFDADLKDLGIQNSLRFAAIEDKVSILNRVLYGMVGLLGTATIISILKLIYIK